jgi:type I restriction enzyme M protein
MFTGESAAKSTPLILDRRHLQPFLRRPDELQTLEDVKAARLNQSVERHIFPKGKDPMKRRYEDLRWQRFKNIEAREMYEVSWLRANIYASATRKFSATRSSGSIASHSNKPLGSMNRNRLFRTYA